jgi:twinkle protein
MRIQSSNTKQIFDFYPENKNGEERYLCPECSKSRKKSKDKCVAWDTRNQRGYCHNCGATFFEFKPFKQVKEYFIPEWKNETKLSDEGVKWFTNRMISQQTLIKMKVYTSKEFMPQFDKEVDVICFPYFREGKLINIKFRGKDKSFKQIKGAELIWYNYDAILDNKTVIICEGEIDLLTFLENGFESVISVPSGAGGKELEFLDNTIEYFKNIDKVLLATDIDSKGIELRDELIRRIGAEKCFTFDLEGCKDANEYFCRYGGIRFKDLKTKKVPYKGIVNVEDFISDIENYIEEGIKPGLPINFEEIDEYITWETGWLSVVTGVPASGKSEFIDYICVKLNLNYGWKIAYFTPENYPLIHHYRKIFEKIAGKDVRKFQEKSIIWDISEYINDNFFYILDEDDLTINKILDSAKYLVQTKGIKILVIDPYNTIDHRYDKGETETKYISEFLTKLKLFARLNDVLVFLIAHPTKMLNGEIPSLYSISGSAHFRNKCDYGIIVHRETNKDTNTMTGETKVFWNKIRFKHLGQVGVSKLIYNYNNGRYERLGTGILEWDNSNWLKNEN